MPSFFGAASYLSQASRGPGAFAVAAARVSSFPPVSRASVADAAVAVARDASQQAAECAAAGEQLAAAEVRASVEVLASVADDSVPGDCLAVPLAVEPQAGGSAQGDSAALQAVEPLADDSLPVG